MPATNSSRPAIAIAGAGIAGMTAAIALAKRGFRITVYERASEFGEIGAGIQLSPNAMQVLRRLDLHEHLIQHAIHPVAIDIRVARTGKTLTSIALKEQCEARYGAPYIVIHRADLMDALLAAAQQLDNITLHSGTPLSDVVPQSDRVGFSAGDEQTCADLLLAADGVHSAIRQDLTGRAAADLSRIAWRATIRQPLFDDLLPADRTGLWLGDGVHLVHYALRAGRELNLVLVGHAAADDPSGLLDRFHAPVRSRLANVDWLAWPLMSVDPDCDWYRGRVVFLGDAAHAMLPTSAQGGAQAIEDAYVLSQCLDQNADDPDIALSTWQKRRKPRVLRIANQARDNLRVYGLGGLAASARNLAIQALPGRHHIGRLDWLYGWRPDADRKP